MLFSIIYKYINLPILHETNEYNSSWPTHEVAGSKSLLIKSYFYFQLYPDPAKIVNFTTEYLVGVGQSATLYCEAEGNPPSNYTWTPCNKFVKGKVCDKKTLVISQVCEDANYTCKVANELGFDSKTANVCKLLFSLTPLLPNSGRFCSFFKPF